MSHDYREPQYEVHGSGNAAEAAAASGVREPGPVETFLDSHVRPGTAAHRVSSPAADVNTSPSRASIAWLRALRLSGRSMVTQSMPSRVSTRISSMPATLPPASGHVKRRPSCSA